ncbi:MAG TPA: hypothetical protein HPP76_08830 [Desulfuromonadales bacterium]|nr:hypothetical protein [Desulfuromonadales bacterium]
MNNMIDNADQAKRLARAILSDVAMYNKEKVENGIKNDDIFDSLKDELEEGRQHFLSRVSTDISPDLIYEIAVVDVLIKRAGKIESSIW